MTDDPIALNFTYEQSEYIRAIRCYHRRAISLPMDLLVSTICLAMAGHSINQNGWTATNVLLVVIGISLVAMEAWVLFGVPYLSYAWQPKLKQNYSLQFSDACIEFHTVTIDARLEWPTYERWEANDEFYMLYHGKRDVTVIPRRAFANQAADEAFRALLTRKLGESGRA